ncbi:NAD(P)H-hydrate dehydratase [uncultured Sphingomonas sp.]|uniref:NAD(P)H-hydrate dehydratase n=1 Tax=uncultured Sphingomonas sp. TaxID=158754 RepID=UPI003457241A
MMIPIAGTAVLTAAQMRAAEETAIVAGTGVATLMQRAGAGVADAVRRLAGVNEMLVLCGPGNNGGDGYIAAARLHAAGRPVRVAAAEAPRTAAAIAARALWTGAVEPLATAAPAPVVVDALFGTGLARALDAGPAAALSRLVRQASLAIAVDVPSGLAADDGAPLGDVPAFHVTLALSAVKPAHLLQPAASRCGAVRVIPIGVATDSDAHVLSRPVLAAPATDAHKFTRGMVAVVRGRMAGAAQLAAQAAMHAGAGYVELLGPTIPGAPHALVRRRCDDAALGDERIGALLIGPGLGRDDEARALLDRALATDCPLVIDGDALHLVTPEQLFARRWPVILTPHAGEFAALFGDREDDKLSDARAAATRSDSTLVFKGPDTVIAAPDGRAILAPAASSWLSTAGSGDVLAGAIAAMWASGLDPLEAAAAGVWLHGEAARRLAGAFIADDLAKALGGARA